MKKTIKDYMIVLFGSGVSRAISFVNTVIIARLLGPEEFGKFSLFYIVMVLSWQFPQAFDVTFVRYAKEVSDSESKIRILRTTLFLKMVYTMGVVILSCPLAIFLGRYIFNKPELWITIAFAIISGSVFTFLMSIASTFQEKGEFTVFSVLYSAYTIPVLFVLLMSKVIGVELDLQKIVAVFVFVSVVIGVISFWWLYKKCHRLYPIDQPMMIQVVDLGKWIFGSIILFFIFSRSDVLFLAHRISLKDFGVYSISAQFIMALNLITGTLNSVFMPKAAIALKSKKSWGSYIKESMVATVLIWLCISGIMIFAGVIIENLYGSQFIGATSILRLLLVGWFCYAAYLPFSFIFYSLDDSRSRFFVEFGKIVLVFSLFPIMFRWYSMTGAASSITVCMFLEAMVALIIVFSKVKHKLNVQQEIMDENLS